jgi:hypothetical protein
MFQNKRESRGERAWLQKKPAHLLNRWAGKLLAEKIRLVWFNPRYALFFQGIGFEGSEKCCCGFA